MAEKREIDVISDSDSSSDEEQDGKDPTLDTVTVKNPKSGVEYKILEQLGAGTFGAVFLGERVICSTKVAIKLASERGCAREMLQRESKAMEKLKTHPGLVKRVDAFTDPQSLNFLLIMQFVSEGDLCDRIPLKRGLPEAVAGRVFAQVLLAVEHMHAHKLVHADLKPDNILVTSRGRVKLCDFGMTRSFDPQSDRPSQVPSGTLHYAPPEALARQRIPTKKMPLIDVWALAATLFTMLAGDFFLKGTEKSVLEDIKRGKTKDCLRRLKGRVTKDVIELLEDMFIPDLNYRMTIEEVKRHKWTAPFVKKLQEDYRARNSVKALGKGATPSEAARLNKTMAMGPDFMMPMQPKGQGLRHTRGRLMVTM